LVLLHFLTAIAHAQKVPVSPKSTEAKSNPESTHQHDSSWPSFWNQDKEASMREEVVVGVISTRYEGLDKSEYRWVIGISFFGLQADFYSCSFPFLCSRDQHHRISSLEATWATPARRERMVEIYTDDPVDYAVTNPVATRCGSDDNYGRWCKFTHMLKVWTTPRYRNVKWFVVVLDTSYLHLENLYEFVSTLNSSKPQLIGDINCDAIGVKYASGKAGFIFSKGVRDTMQFDIWYQPTRISLRKNRYEYDKMWSKYAHATEATLIKHSGMISYAYTASSDLLDNYNKWVDHPWPFPFRPISSNQEDDMEYLPELHKRLHLLKNPDAEILFPISTSCNCKRGFESRCLADASLTENQISCQYSRAELKCLGDGLFDFDEHSKLVNKNQ
jgi:hypothetical protein